MREPTEAAGPTAGGRPLLRLLRYVWPHIGLLATSTVLRVVNLFLGVGLMGLAGWMIASAVGEGRLPTATLWVVLVCVGVLKAAARYAEQVSGHVAAFRILDTLRGEIYDGFTARTSGQRSLERTGDIVSRAMADVELVEVYFAHTLAPVTAAGLFVVVAAVGMGIVIGPIGGILVALLLIAAGVAVPALFQRIGLAHGMKTRESAGRLSAETGEVAAGIQDLVSAGALDRAAARLRGLGREYAKHTSELARLASAKSAIVDLLLVTSLVVVACLGHGATGGAGSAAVWAAVTGLAGGFGAILAVSRAVDDLPKSVAAAVRVLEIVESAGEPAPEPLPAASRSGSVGMTPRLSVRSVTYRYPTGNGISDVSFIVAPGEHLFVTGPSGSGKSTLAAVLLRLVQPQTGAVVLDEAPVQDYDDERYRRVVSAAPQDPGLLRGTVTENVLLGLPLESSEASAGQTDADAAAPVAIPDAAIEVAALDSLFADLPDGAQTLAGGADEQISGGQKKRLSIARMITRDPRIIVLDEAFAGLDPTLRMGVRKRFLGWARAGGRSVLEFSHELLDAADADHVIVLDHGNAVEAGTVDELTAQSGFFSRLLDAQSTGIPIDSTLT